MDASKINDSQTPEVMAAKINALEAAIEEKDHLLLELEKMAGLGKLTAGIAHEINTPLAALRSNYDLFNRCLQKIQMLSENDPDMETKPEQKKIEKLFGKLVELNKVNETASKQIVNIVNGVRHYARRDDTEAAAVDLHEILDHTLMIVNHKLKNRVEVQKDYQPVAKVMGFPTRLSQVFVNIIVNAAQAIEGQGSIFLNTENQADKAVVEIRDTGKGMPPEKIKRIFDVGFTTKARGEGMGLGLSLVYKIIADHHGKIEVESEVGAGTTFRIILPAHKA